MIEERLKSLNIVLPSPPKPAGSYVSVTISGKIAYVSGQIPIADGKITHKGKVPVQQPVEEAQKAARLCIINALAQLKSEIGSLDKISRILKVSGFVNSASDFVDQPKVINGASDLLFEIFGEKGKHSRVSIGAASLPLDSTVEIDMTVELS
jgi:enamine deaminase RidA (YjgF/YER057c/UK114 family)